jgi:hypothetical protein
MQPYSVSPVKSAAKRIKKAWFRWPCSDQTCLAARITRLDKVIPVLRRHFLFRWRLWYPRDVPALLCAHCRAQVAAHEESRYYPAESFRNISGMFHRMRQNARGLATICILSTKLVVPTPVRLALSGREEMTRGIYPFDGRSTFQRAHTCSKSSIRWRAERLAAQNNVTLSADGTNSRTSYRQARSSTRNNFVGKRASRRCSDADHYDGSFRFDVSVRDHLSCVIRHWDHYSESFADTPKLIASDIFTSVCKVWILRRATVPCRVLRGAFSRLRADLYYKQVTEGMRKGALRNSQPGLHGRRAGEANDQLAGALVFFCAAATALQMLFASRLWRRCSFLNA